MKRIISTAVSIYVFSFLSILTAQNFTVKASFDSIAMFIGDQATLSFVVSQDKGLNVAVTPLNEDILGKLEVVEFLKYDTLADENAITVTHAYKVTAFDSTLALIPSLPFVCGSDTQYSNPIILKVIDVPVDTTQMAITDIKQIQEPPFDYYLMYTIIGITTLVILLIVFMYFIVKKLKKGTKGDAVSLPVDTRTPFEIADDSLIALKDKKLYQQGRTKEYFTELTDIMRVFFSNKYGIDALESTSEELVAEVKYFDVSKRDSSFLVLLKDILIQSDLVKFAKYVPEMRDCENAFDKVSKVIDIDKNITQEISKTKENTK